MFAFLFQIIISYNTECCQITDLTNVIRLSAVNKDFKLICKKYRLMSVYAVRAGCHGSKFFAVG